MIKKISVSNSILTSQQIGEHRKRVRLEGYRKPLRTFQELAEEFGVSCHVLRGFLCQENAPKPKFKTGLRTTKGNTWYDPDEMRTWWKSRI